jgi:hypothetical protein
MIRLSIEILLLTGTTTLVSYSTRKVIITNRFPVKFHWAAATWALVATVFSLATLIGVPKLLQNTDPEILEVKSNQRDMCHALVSKRDYTGAYYAIHDSSRSRQLYPRDSNSFTSCIAYFEDILRIFWLKLCHQAFC